MPRTSKHPCPYPGCGVLVEYRTTYCPKHQVVYTERNREYDKTRPEVSSITRRAGRSCVTGTSGGIRFASSVFSSTEQKWLRSSTRFGRQQMVALDWTQTTCKRFVSRATTEKLLRKKRNETGRWVKISDHLTSPVQAGQQRLHASLFEGFSPMGKEKRPF